MDTIVVADAIRHLTFRSVHREGRSLSFPCSEQGHVLLDALSERARMNYLYARAMVGLEFFRPLVQDAPP